MARIFKGADRLNILRAVFDVGLGEPVLTRELFVKCVENKDLFLGKTVEEDQKLLREMFETRDRMEV